jgi:mRNA interferase MazF
MQKDFDEWTKTKKIVDNTSIGYNFFYHEREIWWSSIGLNIGVETDGKNDYFERPILVIKKFNKHMFWGIPLTSHKKEGIFYFEIKHSKGISWAMLAQMRTFSTKRLLRKMTTVPRIEFHYLKTKIIEYLV